MPGDLIRKRTSDDASSLTNDEACQTKKATIMMCYRSPAATLALITAAFSLIWCLSNTASAFSLPPWAQRLQGPAHLPICTRGHVRVRHDNRQVARVPSTSSLPPLVLFLM